MSDEDTKTIKILRNTRIGANAAPIGSVHKVVNTDARFLVGCGKAVILTTKDDIAEAKKAFSALQKATKSADANAQKGEV